MTEGIVVPILDTADLSLGYRNRVISEHLDFAVERGTVTALVGPNGSGKSTLLMALARVLRPRCGVVRLDGTPLGERSSIDIARRLAILPQTAVAPPGLRVRELVEQGRYPRLGALSMLRRCDDEAMQRAMSLTGIETFAERKLDSLSGGERQRAWIAMALAQETEILLLDEPTTYLDVRHQIDLLELVVDLVRAHGKTVVMVLHDLNQAARYSDRIVALRDGAIVADGHPAEVVTAHLLEHVFGVRARIITDPVAGRPMFVAE
ncbi:MAG: ABC transporter ATP-binding protein [Rhodococcus sp. (in: high G+C Gram-positive bacteria)]